MTAKSPLWTEARWDEGYLHVHGYFYVHRSDHPAELKGYVRRHHVVWWLRTGQVVPAGMVLHHVNGVKTDDRFENLQLMTHGEHIRLHFSKPPVVIPCLICGNLFETTQGRINSGRLCCSRACGVVRVQRSEGRAAYKEKRKLIRAEREGQYKWPIERREAFGQAVKKAWESGSYEGVHR